MPRKKNTLSRGKFKFKKVIKCVYNKLDTQVRGFVKLVTVKERKNEDLSDEKLKIKNTEAHETSQDEPNAANEAIDEEKITQDDEVDAPEDENVKKKEDSITAMKMLPFRFTKF